METISLVSAGFKYASSEKWVFRNLALMLNAGEGVRITGRNGSGKSTLLKVCARLLELTEGTIRSGSGVRAVYMDQFASAMLAPGLTIADHFIGMRDRSGGAIDPEDTIARFGLSLDLRRNDFVGHLSGGERQIVALLCTLASGANLLCLDEFTAALDDRSATLADELVEYARATAKVTVLIVSHQYREWKAIRDVSLCELTQG